MAAILKRARVAAFTLPTNSNLKDDLPFSVVIRKHQTKDYNFVNTLIFS